MCRERITRLDVTLLIILLALIWPSHMAVNNIPFNFCTFLLIAPALPVECAISSTGCTFCALSIKCLSVFTPLSVVDKKRENVSRYLYSVGSG